MGILLQVRFATEFAAFLVAVAGIAVVSFGRGLAPHSVQARWLLRMGFALSAVAAALTGSALGAEPSSTSFPAVLFLRATGLLLLAVGSLKGIGESDPWQGDEGARVLWWFGLAAEAMNVAFSLMGTVSLDPIMALAIADLSIAFTLARVGRRAVATRVATAAGAALLVMVLVMSVALSVIIDSTLRTQALQRLGTSSQGRSAAILTLTTQNLRDLSYLFAQLVASYSSIRCPGAGGFSQARCVQAAVSAYSSRYFPSEGALWVSPTGHVVATSPKLNRDLSSHSIAALAAGRIVADSIKDHAQVSAVEVTDGRAWAVASAPDLVKAPNGSTTLVGVAILVSPLDSKYLTQSRLIDPSISFALSTPLVVAARSGDTPSRETLTHLASVAISHDRTIQSANGAYYSSVEPLPGLNGISSVALVATEPASTVMSPEDSIFKTIFLIAIGGTVLALLLAGAVGERVGSSLRRLTVAAQAIRHGDAGARAEVEAQDEVGTLGEAFDAMAASIEEKTDALQEAAHDEARLRRRIEAVVGGIEEALLAVDGEGSVTDFNPAAEELFGLAASEAIGRPADLTIKLESATGEPIALSAVAAFDGQSPSEAQIRRSDLPPIPVACVSGTLSSPGAPIEGAVYLFRDLRSERAVEQMKTEFLSRISHELRTPLTGIIGFTDLLSRRDVSPERAQTWHANILEQAKRIARTVELLEFVATTGAGRVVLHPVTLNLSWLLGDVAARWQRKVGAGCQVLSSASSNLPDITADSRWLTFALDELMDNAVKFSEDPASVSIKATAALDGQSILISVIDGGKGMTAAERDAAFGEFVQGDGSDTRSYGGLGLGLVLVRRVAEAHDGWVTCDSAQGKGCTMSIHLPLPGRLRMSGDVQGSGDLQVPGTSSSRNLDT